MSLHIPYSTPVRTDICVAFCFFNPIGYIRPLQNTAFFQEKLRLANIPYYSIEMLIDDKPAMLANPTLCVRSKSTLFYKEALWNRLEKEIPPQYTKIVFLDSDVIFSEENWLDKISILLDSCDLVHPFETVDRLNLAYEKVDTLISSVKDGNLAGSGMGWAITRDTFHALGGFFDKGILGNGDTLFYNCIRESVNIKDGQYFLIQDLYTTYRTNFQNVNPKITYLDMKIYHLFHGTTRNRNYGSRHNEVLGDIHKPWDSLFTLNEDGFWELTDDSLNNRMIEYFLSRREDSQDVDTLVNKIVRPVTQATLMNVPRPSLINKVIQQTESKQVQKPVQQQNNNFNKPSVIKPITTQTRSPVAIPLRYLSAKRI